MKIQPVVEGRAEVEAFPELLRRLVAEAGAWRVQIGRPIRKSRSDLVKRDGFRTAVRLAGQQLECGAILVLLDGDDDCPAELGPRMRGWAETAAGGRPCEVVLAHREYEAWFLAAIESLRGRHGIRADATSHSTPEGPRDAKTQVQLRMIERRHYTQTGQQPAFSALFSLPQAYRGSRSFRKLVGAVGALLRGMGQDPGLWPPPSWTAAV